MDIRQLSRTWWVAFVAWCKRPPRRDDAFFVNLRTALQQFFPCQHVEWKADTPCERKCLRCGKTQHLIINTTNPEKSIWVDLSP